MSTYTKYVMVPQSDLARLKTVKKTQIDPFKNANQTEARVETQYLSDILDDPNLTAAEQLQNILDREVYRSSAINNFLLARKRKPANYPPHPRQTRESIEQQLDNAQPATPIEFPRNPPQYRSAETPTALRDASDDHSIFRGLKRQRLFADDNTTGQLEQQIQSMHDGVQKDKIEKMFRKMEGLSPTDHPQPERDVRNTPDARQPSVQSQLERVKKGSPRSRAQIMLNKLIKNNNSWQHGFVVGRGKGQKKLTPHESLMVLMDASNPSRRAQFHSDADIYEKFRDSTDAIVESRPNIHLRKNPKKKDIKEVTFAQVRILQPGGLCGSCKKYGKSKTKKSCIRTGP